MIIAKGFTYYDDYEKPDLIKHFDTLEALEDFIKGHAIRKDLVHTPTRTMTGLSTAIVRSFDSHLYFPIKETRNGYVEIHINLIETTEGILYSSGELNHDDGHIGRRARELFDRIDEWKEQKNYID